MEKDDQLIYSTSKREYRFILNNLFVYGFAQILPKSNETLIPLLKSTTRILITNCSFPVTFFLPTICFLLQLNFYLVLFRINTISYGTCHQQTIMFDF